MFCLNCGTKCDDDATVCLKCGCSLNSQKQIEKPPCPPNYLVLSIISIFACFLSGSVALVSSFLVNYTWKDGNYEEALKCSKMAKRWVIISFIFGVIAWAIPLSPVLVNILNDL